MKTTYLLLALPALLLTGCSTAVSPKESATINPQKTGLVLATVNQPGEKDTWLEFTLHSLDGHDSSFRYPSITTKQELWLVEVPAGRYQLEHWAVAESWTVTDGAESADAGLPTAPVAFEFEVRPGEITYLGDFDVPALRSRRPIVLVDHHKYARTLFQRQYPALADMPVRNVAPEQVALVRAFDRIIPSFYITVQTSDPLAQMPTGPKFPAE